MISSFDEQVVVALRVAAGSIPLPPESRWVREQRSPRADWLVATVAVAIIALVAVLAALRAEPRSVPGSVTHTIPPSDSLATFAPGAVTLDISDDAPWITARARASLDLVVLKPTWIPRPLDSASACDLNAQRLGADTTSEEYHVWYLDLGPINSRSRCTLLFGAHRDVAFAGDLPNYTPAPIATFVTRGSVVYVRQRSPSDPVYLGWIENGAFYEVIAEGFQLSDLIRAVNGLEPVR